jgi:hypothetical protein
MKRILISICMIFSRLCKKVTINSEVIVLIAYVSLKKKLREGDKMLFILTVVRELHSLPNI